MESFKTRYVNLTLIQENEIGEVYQAIHPSHSTKFVSIQTLDPQKINADQQQALLAYFRKSQQLHSTFFNPILEVQSSAPAYYVQELPQGERLSQLLENRWTEDQILGLALDLFQGLSLIHEKNIVFGPLDFDDIYLRPSLNKSESIETNRAFFVLQGYRHFFSVEASPWKSYEPPEAQNQQVTDGRSDIYRAGRLLLELFSRQSGADCSKIIEQLRCTLPLKTIFQKMTAPYFLERYSNAIRVLKDLQNYLGERLSFTVSEVQEKPFLLGQFVGRQEEWSQLKKWSQSSPSKLLLVSGVSGIGKNRLVEEFLATLTAEGKVITSRCKPYAELYHPFQEIFLQLENDPVFATHQALFASQKALFQEHKQSPLASRSIRNAIEHRLKMQIKLGEWILECARTQKLFFYFQDLHEADQESLLLLHYLLRNTSSERPIQFFATLHQENETTLRSFLSDLEQENRLSIISLYGLDTPEASRLISTLLGMNEPPINFARKLNESAEGSPLFLSHLLLWMIENQTLFLQESYWEVDVDDLEFLELPDTFQTVFLERYENLSREEKKVLQFLAFHDGTLVLAQIEALTEINETLCFEILLQLQKKLWITCFYQQGVPHYRLYEQALREYLRELLSIEEYQHLLQKISLFFAHQPELAISYAIQGNTTEAFQKAFHYFKKQSLVSPSLALITKLQQAKENCSPSNFTSEIMEWACSLWREWGQVPFSQRILLQQFCVQVQEHPESVPLHLYLSLAESLIFAQEKESALKWIHLATKKGARLSDILLIEMEYHLSQENYEETIQLGEHFLSKSDQENVLVYFLLGKANKHLASVEKLAYEDSQDNFEAMIRAGEKTNDIYAQMIGYYELAKDALPNRPQDAKDALDATFHLGEPPPKLFCQISILSGLCLTLLGNLSEALEAYQQGTQQAQSLGLGEFVIEGYTSLASTYRELGRFALAKEALARAWELSTSHYEPYKNLIRVEQARLHLELFDIESALDDLEEAEFPVFLGMVQDASFLHQLELGRAFLLLGNSSKALKQFNKAVSLLNPTKDWLYMACAFMYIGAVHVEDQDSKKAMVALSKAESLARLLNHPFIECWLNYLHGLNSVLKENSFLAKKFLNKAEKTIQKYPNLNLQWRILTAHGKVLLREGQLLEARRKLEKAAQICQQLIASLSSLEQNTFSKIQSYLSLHKALSALEQQNRSLEGTPSPKKVVEALKNRLSQTEVDEGLDLEAQNERLRVLFQINEKLNSTFNENALPLIVETGIRYLKAQQGFLLLLKEGKFTFRVASDAQGISIKQPQNVLPEKFLKQILTQERENPVLQTTFQEKQLILLALHTVEKNIGILSFLWLPQAEPISAEDLTWMRALASQAAIALENMELYQSLEKKKDELARSIKDVEKINHELKNAHKSLADKVQAQSIEIQEVRDQLAEKQNELEFKYNYDHIIGQSPKIKEIFKILDKVIDSKVPILIHGESGTGKELIAKAVHFNGERRKKNFCAENCAALTDSLLESELFGYTKGAFTGATNDRKGLFEIADQGTLFLDEVGDMSANMQKKLLRVLQEGEIRRVGSKKTIPVNVRIISATHRDLRTMVSEGLFREDLYYRLNVVQIKLPPLRERIEDIPLLVQHFFKTFQNDKSSRSPVLGISQNAIKLLQSYSWPGNIRELHNTLMSAISLADTEILTEADFYEKLSHKNFQVTQAQSYEELFKQELSLDQFLQKVVENCQEQYNDTQLAEMLGITRKTLWQKRKSWGLTKS